LQERRTFEELVSRWHELHQQGLTPSAEELCADCPEQLVALKRHLAQVAAMHVTPGISQPEHSSRHGADSVTVTETGSPTRPGNTPGPEGTICGYEIIGELGRGGMGVVYQARQSALKRLVALKMILAGSHAGTEQQKRFRIEAEAVARLQHPNIVQIHEIGEVEGRPFFSMEFVAGGSLAARLRAGLLPLRETARLVETLARAVQHAHQRGVVHRDLKPVNILLTEDGTPKITDFGLAKQLESADAGQTRSGAVLGTPSYMAPEQAAGKTDQLGPPVDVYALGAILYELLTSRPPFRGATMMETLQQVMHAEVPPPSRLRPGIDRDLETICLKALAKEPAQRYASALGLAQDLERYQAGEPILARRAGIPSRLWRRVRQHPGKIMAATLLLLAGAAAVVGYATVSSTRREAALASAFEEGLPESEWTAERAEALEGVLADWETLDPAKAAAARRKLLDRFATLFRAALKNPRLEPDDMARLQGDLQWLASRDGDVAQSLREEMGQRGRAWQPRIDLKSPWQERDRVFAPGLVEAHGELLKAVKREDAAVVPVMTRVGSQGRVRLEAAFDASWRDARAVGLWLGASPKPNQASQGYKFRLVAGDGLGSTPQAVAKSFRHAEGAASLQVLRNGVILRRKPIVVAPGPLTLSVGREGDRLQVQVNGGEPLVFFDAIPLHSAAAQVFGIDWPAGVGLKHLRATGQTLPEAASPLERGDQLYDEGQYPEALALYQEQAIAAPRSEAGREARCKAGLCLVQMNRLDEAAALFEPLAAEVAERWPLVAACQLWLLRLQRGEETGPLFATLSARLRPGELATYVAQDLKDRLFRMSPLTKFEMLLPNARVARRLEESVELADLFEELNARCMGRYHLAIVQALLGAEDRARPVIAEAKPLALQAIASLPSTYDYPVWIARWDAWLVRRHGQPRPALQALQAYVGDVTRALENRFPDDPKLQKLVAPLHLDVARLHAALGEWVEAEREVDTFLKLTPDPIANYNHYANGWLLKGFLCEQRKAPEEAQRAWKEGLYSSFARKLPAGSVPKLPPVNGLEGIVTHVMMASLTDQLPDAEAEALWDLQVQALGDEGLVKQIAGKLRLSPAAMRGMWRSPHARDLARRLALLDVSPLEHVHFPILAGVAEKFRQDALGGQPTPEQDDVIWQATRACLDALAQGKMTQFQGLQLAMTWGGTTNALGWNGIAPQLDPGLRGPVAYVLGHRYLHLKTNAGAARRDDALLFFRTAQKDAPAASTLERLSQREVQRLEQGK
jgi:tetratricopeptide (TPR) repeat protein